jgi:adenylate cyclase
MSDKNSKNLAKLPIYFHWGIRLLLWIFFTVYLFLAGFPADLQAELIAGVSAYAFLIVVISFSEWYKKPILLQFILLLDAFILGFLSTYTGLGISTIALAATLVIIWLVSPSIMSLFYLFVLFIGAATLSFYYVQIIDFSDWGILQQLGIVLGTIIAVVGLSGMRRDLGFTKQELAVLQRNQAGLKLRNYEIAKYLPAPLRERISRTKQVKASTSRKKLTVFFSDLVGFSQMSEEMEPNDLSRILDSYLSEMAEIADKYGATVDKFIGDGIMIFFGDPKSKGTKEDAETCVAMALDMQRSMNLLQIKWRQEGIDRNLEVRMGINTGFCTVGNFGSNDRMNYTAVGTEVNLASRLETACTPGEVLVSSSTFLLIQDKFVCKSRGDIQVKGFAEPIPVFRAVGNRADMDNAKDYLSYSSAGCSINIDTDAIPTYDRKKVLEALQSANELIQRNFRKQ